MAITNFDTTTFDLPTASLLCLCAVGVAGSLAWRQLRKTQSSTNTSTSSGGEKEFEFPRFDPCPDGVEDIKPVPYRPFRWGDFHVTMGIKNISFGNWVELDNQYEQYHRIRDHRIKKLGSQLVKTLPADPDYAASGADAARELVYELSEYLSRRYPKTFSVTRHSLEKGGEGGWYGEGRIHTITILPVNTTYDLDVDDPMTVSGLLVQDDLALMIKGPNDMYYLRAGAIVTAGFWRLEDKIGMSLDEIHFHGNVPQYPQKLQTSLNRFFLRLPVDKLVQRNNYFFKIVADPSHPVEPLDPNELGWAETTVGNEQEFVGGAGLGALRLSRPDVEDDDSTDAATGEVKVTPAMMRLRMERQSLRRLPKTGAVIFTIRTYVVPAEELVKEVGVPGRAASAIRSWPDDVAGYKTRATWQKWVLPYFDECHRKQVEQGLLKSEDEKPATDYPF